MLGGIASAIVTRLAWAAFAGPRARMAGLPEAVCLFITWFALTVALLAACDVILLRCRDMELVFGVPEHHPAQWRWPFRVLVFVVAPLGCVLAGAWFGWSGWA